ncbi:20S rRNA accumulation protein 4 [Monosporozyma unispora]|nr:20S rRNA accumulation protein [Kazachstania unispora]
MSKVEELPASDDEHTYDHRNSNVFLAFIDTAVKESDELTVEDTFIGGEPIWLHPDSVPDATLLECGSCHSTTHMKLLLQAFSPLDDEQMEEVQLKYTKNINLHSINPNDDRVLYVFICTQCQRNDKSIRCIRGVKKNENTNSTNDKIASVVTGEGKNFQINPFDLNNNGSTNPFGNNPFQAGNNDNPFAKPAATETKGTTEKVEPSTKVLRKLHDSEKDKEFDESKSFKSYLLYVEEERFNNKPDHLKLPNNLKINKEALELTDTNLEEDLDKDPVKMDPRTEKLSQFLDDDTFQKFQEIVGYNPSQVLRYDIGGTPLFYSQIANLKLFENAIPKAAYNLSSRRVFEMQLMPKMILDLEETVSVKEGMEWGTIMVFSDMENYIPKFDEHKVGYVEEFAKIQWESRT